LGNVAAIDIGTNTIRMLVAAREGAGYRPLSRIRRITAMGKSLSDTGAIGDAEFHESIEALREFRSEMDRLEVVHYRACGTAGLREAGNSARFLTAAGSAGIRIEVIPPEEEARLAWAGIRQVAGTSKGVVLMDIGGGSTEFTVGPGAGQSVSLPIGVVVTWSLFKPSDPPHPWQIAAMVHYFNERIASGTRSLPARGVRRMVGTAGTFTTLAALDQRLKTYRPDKIDGHAIKPETLRRWAARLCSLTEAQRLALPGMEKGREKYMIPGLLQAAAAIECFGIRELVISDSGLLEGIIEDLL
jgi:exopolyphosphatase/guanosine-5'-triphosphate,3'-diphosphate pyrophosphatase